MTALPLKTSGATAKPFVFLVNKEAGGARAHLQFLENLPVLLQERGYKSDVKLLPPAALTAALEKATEDPTAVLVIGGGDGTIRACVNTLSETPTPWVFFPSEQ